MATIYIVEDDLNIREIETFALKNSGYSVVDFECAKDFYKKLDESFPGLKNRYIEKYGSNYVLESENNRQLMDLFYKKTAENNILNKPDDVFRYLRDFPNKDKSRQSTLYFN